MKNKNGITLIALVITIIVMLILAGVSINLVVGEDGILSQAQEATIATRIASFKEEADLEYVNEYVDEIYNNELTNMETVSDKLAEKGYVIVTKDSKKINFLDETGNSINNLVLGPQETKKITINIDNTSERYFVQLAGKYYEFYDKNNEIFVDKNGITDVSYINDDADIMLEPLQNYAKIKMGSEEITTSKKIDDMQSEIDIIVGNSTGQEQLVINYDTNSYVLDLNITINAEIIARNPKLYLGKKLTNYTCSNSSEDLSWKIFHSDNNNVYLLSGNLINYSLIPKPEGITFTQYDDYKTYFSVSNSYTNRKFKENADILKWLKYAEFYQDSDFTSHGAKMTAFMLNYDEWSGFCGSDAKYAIGGPTADIIIASSNLYGGRVDFQVDSSGYLFRRDSSSFSHGTFMPYNGHNHNVMRMDEQGDNVMWIAGPSNKNTGIMVGYTSVNGGYIGRVGTYSNTVSVSGVEFNYDDVGFRPLVCLRDGIEFETIDCVNFTIK